MKSLLFKRTKAEYKSRYSLENSIQKLQEVVKSPWNIFNCSRSICGRVTKEKVYLYRMIPFARNSFVPVFNGSFHQQNGEVILSGVYSMCTFVKIFMIIWFGFFILEIIGTLIGVFQEIILKDKSIAELSPMVLIPFVMLFFGIGLVKLGQYLSRNDIDYISKVINDALNK
jgi:hypothetical protein